MSVVEGVERPPSGAPPTGVVVGGTTTRAASPDPAASSPRGGTERGATGTGTTAGATGIEGAFARAATDGRAALLAYVVAGYPDVPGSVAAALTAIDAGADLVGVNQRDLRTFEVDRARALRLAALIPSGVVKVAESGISAAADLQDLAAAGYDAVLVGERLVSAADPGDALRALKLGTG